MGLSHYTSAFGVRSYEIGRMGIISSGTFLRYLEHIATEASAAAGFPCSWYDEQDTAWVVRQMTFEIERPIILTDELAFDTWPSHYARIQAHREYLVSNQKDGRPLARARGHWVYIGRQRGLPARLPISFAEQAAHDPQTVTFSVLPDILPANDLFSYQYNLTARTYEADIMGHVNNTIYMDWLEEAVFDALAQLPTGVFPQHTEASARTRVFLQSGTIDYKKSSLPGDPLTIITTLVGSYDGGLAWSQMIQRAGSEEPMVQAETCWAWLA